MGTRRWVSKYQVMLSLVPATNSLMTPNKCFRILLQRSVPRAHFAIVPANPDGDDVVCFNDEMRTDEGVRFQMLRQQNQKKHTRNLSLQILLPLLERMTG